ncbi:MAG: sodium:calcium antiporter [Firmicutes bacterium]|nr:sodium:calcium antiporter [Bacillota bacterium]
MPANRALHIALMVGTVLLTVPWLVVAFGTHPSAPVTVVLSGLAILGAAFLISWSAELAQFDVSRSLAMALLALIAVLPEYAVDIYLAWRAAHHPEYIPLVAANMTGANRLLVGVGWSAVVFLGWMALRKQGKIPAEGQIPIEPVLAIEVTTLTVATLYSLVLPLKDTITLWDAVVFVLMFAGYVWMAGRAPHIEPEPTGPVATLAALPRGWRRASYVLMFLYSGFIILIATEPFTEGLIDLGKSFGISEFLLIQWIAPLASESPEMIILCYFALRGHVASAMSAIISSKINQWTLLIGSLPIIYSVSAGHFSFLPLEPRPREEVLLTAAQSFFACAVIANRFFSRLEALLLFVLFAVQLLIPSIAARYAFTVLYFVLAMGWILAYRREVAVNMNIFYRLVKRLPVDKEVT